MLRSLHIYGDEQSMSQPILERERTTGQDNRYLEV